MRWIKQKFDRWAIEAAARSLPRIPADPAQAAEVDALLQRADLFLPPEKAPDVKLNASGEFQFTSAVRTPFPKTNTAYGRLFNRTAGAATAPTVVLVHGWNAELHYINILPRVARALNGRGLNAILLELPYHLQRRPGQEEAITNFISENIPRMLEATSQALADINATLHWARQRGARATATWGFSLGGWLAGLHLCLSAAQDAAVLATPVSNLERAIHELAFCHPIRAALQVAPAELTQLNLASRSPRIPPERILLVEGAYDLFVPSDTYVQLAEAWQIEQWLKVPQSHISILSSRRTTRQIIDWLATTLRA